MKKNFISLGLIAMLGMMPNVEAMAVNVDAMLEVESRIPDLRAHFASLPSNMKITFLQQFLYPQDIEKIVPSDAMMDQEITEWLESWARSEEWTLEDVTCLDLARGYSDKMAIGRGLTKSFRYLNNRDVDRFVTGIVRGWFPNIEELWVSDKTDEYASSRVFSTLADGAFKGIKRLYLNFDNYDDAQSAMVSILNNKLPNLESLNAGFRIEKEFIDEIAKIKSSGKGLSEFCEIWSRGSDLSRDYRERMARDYGIYLGEEGRVSAEDKLEKGALTIAQFNSKLRKLAKEWKVKREREIEEQKFSARTEMTDEYQEKEYSEEEGVYEEEIPERD